MTKLFHFTHESNLSSIVANGLKCDNDAKAERLLVTEVGAPFIKKKREGQPVLCRPDGFVADYVPFYFAPRSPMLHNIHRGKVGSYAGGQGPIVYLVTTLAMIEEHGCGYVVTDRNAAVAKAKFFPAGSDLSQVVDWSLMAADGPFFGEKKERRMAELLAYRSLPFSAILGLGIRSDANLQSVRSRMIQMSAPPPVEIRPDWYF